jgi:glucosyl-dolichyl phosphate glucuronosyltransferase
MRLTVAICTRDRAHSLRRCLDSLRSVNVPHGLAWELIVVDNGSTDDTADVAAACRGVLPLRLVREETPGLSNARNRAVAEALGDYILWTDDDAGVDAMWLVAYAAAFRAHPTAGVFGGPIEPVLEGNPPAWLRAVLSRVGGAFARRDLGPCEVPLAAPGALPYGANYAVRIQEQRAHPYDPQLGRQPGALGLGNEETEVLAAILAGGGGGWWVPDARVYHHIARERQTLAYLRRSFAAEGEFLEVSGRAPDASDVDLWRVAIQAELRYRVRALLRRPEHWITDIIIASEARGRLAARRRVHPRRGQVIRT